MSAPIDVENLTAKWDRSILDFVNDASRFGSGRFMDQRFLEKLRAFEKRVIQLRMQLEQRLDAGSTAVE